MGVAAGRKHARVSKFRAEKPRHKKEGMDGTILCPNGSFTMIAASAILRPISDVSVDYKDDASVSSTARTLKASNHDPQPLAQRKKVRTEDTFHPTSRRCILKLVVSKLRYHSSLCFHLHVLSSLQKMSAPSNLSGERRLTGESMEQTTARIVFTS